MPRAKAVHPKKSKGNADGTQRKPGETKSLFEIRKQQNETKPCIQKVRLARLVFEKFT